MKYVSQIHWRHPVGYNEKIQIFKITREAENLWPYVDKYEVRKYVAAQIGPAYLNVLHGVFDRVEDIDLSQLPRSFILKATHGSGWNIICRNRRQFDWPDAQRKLSSWLKLNYYQSFGRERQYRQIRPKIVCEKFKQVRVDLYNIKGKIYFGELTFTPGNGAIKFEPPTWDLVFGKLWV